MNTFKRYKFTSIFGLVFVLIVIFGFFITTRIESDCQDKGGFVKWIYGAKTTNYLCISPDGRIIG